MKISAEPYQPESHQVFWCHQCGAEKVNSKNEETGKFFVFHGHSFDNTTHEYDGDYHGVMFALCSECLSN